MESRKNNKNPVFVDLFINLPPKKRADFLRFVSSPYFNTQKILSQALECLNSNTHYAYPKLKSILAAELYGRAEVEDVKLRLLWSDLLQLFKTYLLLDPLKGDRVAKELAFVKYLRQCKRNANFETHAIALRKKLVAGDRWDPEWYERRYNLEREIYSYESSKNRFTLFDFQRTSDFFEIANLIKRLRSYVNQIAQEALSSSHYPYPFIEEWIQLAKEKQWLQFPEVNMYIMAIDLYRNESDQRNFQNYLNLLKKYEEQFDYETSRELHILALNYSIRRVNNNEIQYHNTVLQLYQTGANHGWLLDNGMMTSFTYKNIISLCIRMGDLDLATQMLNKYKNLVNPAERNSIYQFNQARIFKEQREYGKALYLLNTSVFKDLLIELSARVEMIKIYYEIGERDLIQNQITATKSLLRRSKKLGYQRDFYANFLTNAQQLVNSTRISLVRKRQWLDQLKGERKLTDKSWVISMVDRLPTVLGQQVGV